MMIAMIRLSVCRCPLGRYFKKKLKFSKRFSKLTLYKNDTNYNQFAITYKIEKF